MNEEEAKSIALRALSYLVAEEDVLQRFMDLSGVDAADIRQRADDVDMLAGVLDFFLGFLKTKSLIAKNYFARLFGDDKVFRKNDAQELARFHSLVETNGFGQIFKKNGKPITCYAIASK